MHEHAHDATWIGIAAHTLMITWFVLAVMSAAEIVDALVRRGRDDDDHDAPGTGAAEWHERGGCAPAGAFAGAALGLVPGCFGAFTAVSLFARRRMGFAGMYAATVTTLGDEVFVMAVQMPGVTATLSAVLFALAVVTAAPAAWIWRALGGRDGAGDGPGEHVHGDHEHHDDGPARLWAGDALVAIWRKHAGFRLAALAVTSALTAMGMAEYRLHGHATEAAFTLIGVAAFFSVLVAFGSDHLLEDHLWKHVIRVHAPRLTLWIGAALTMLALVHEHQAIETLLRASPEWAVIGAALLGLIPASGPHIVVVAAFADGVVPLSALAANAVVQDGHGLLPLIAHRPAAAVTIKLLKLAPALAVAAALRSLGM